MKFNKNRNNKKIYNIDGSIMPYEYNTHFFWKEGAYEYQNIDRKQIYLTSELANLPHNAGNYDWVIEVTNMTYSENPPSFEITQFNDFFEYEYSIKQNLKVGTNTIEYNLAVQRNLLFSIYLNHVNDSVDSVSFSSMTISGKKVIISDKPYNDENNIVLTPTPVIFNESFGGSVLGDPNPYTIPSSAESFAAFANINRFIYTFSFENGGKITFNASTVDTGAIANIKFRFEKEPFPNVDPAFETEQITVTDLDTSFIIEISSQDSNTFSSFLLYIIETDVSVNVSDVLVYKY